LGEGMAELVPGRADLRHAQLPRGQRLAHAAALLAEVPLDGPRLDDLVPVERRDHVDPDVPAFSRLQLDLPLHALAVRVAGLREEELCAGLLAVRRLEEILVVLAVELRLD